MMNAKWVIEYLLIGDLPPETETQRNLLVVQLYLFTLTLEQETEATEINKCLRLNNTFQATRKL